MNIQKINTLADLKKSSYTSKSIKEELRDNLIVKLQNKERVFEGILAYDQTVIPDVERAILSQHNILLLGLRGQAKTRIARLMVNLLDEYIPVVTGSEINDDPLQPISKAAIAIIEKHGDKTPISWIHRSERYVEKLATPDVSVADLIGDVDPIKAASLKLPYSDERVIHFGLVPRSHRSIFVINELPDLQARIQVSLFNMLQEGDLQIRGFKLRLPLDIQFVFTANPEDYTNRGSIVTPLKDRIESQILTHYPESLEDSMAITLQEAKLHENQIKKVHVPSVFHEILELVSFNARNSDFIDENSGVSARLSISAYENLISAAERRMLINGESSTTVRLSDFWGMIPAVTGKVELVYEGEQEGHYNVAIQLINQAIKDTFSSRFINPNDYKRTGERDSYDVIREYFNAGNSLEMLNDDSDKNYQAKLEGIAGLKKVATAGKVDEKETYSFMELVLHGLTQYQVIGRDIIGNGLSFGDPLSDMLDDLDNIEGFE